MNSGKRLKTEMTSSLISKNPSTTIVVMNIPPNVTDNDIRNIFQRYGALSDIQKLNDNCSALVEFIDLNQSTMLVQTARLNPFYVGNNQVRMEFSTQSISGYGTISSKVLDIIINNVTHEINVEVMHTICTPYGRLMKVVVGKKRPDNTLVAQVEFETPQDAKQAKDGLDGNDIYSNCCNLTVTFSDSVSVYVFKNDSESWDYSTTNYNNGAPQRGCLLGDPPQNKSILSHYSNGQGNAMNNDYFGNRVSVIPNMASNNALATPQITNVSAITPVPGSLGAFSPFVTAPGCVTFFNKLAEGINCDKLFNLVSLYGNVARIKFLKSRPGVAMVQMGNPESAQNLLIFINGQIVMGQGINLSPCQQLEITEGGQVLSMDDGTPYLKNYMHSPNNRFRTPATTAKCRILPPSATLHFFNAPLHITEEDVRGLFSKNNAPDPNKVAVFPPKEGQKNSLGLVEWTSLSDALDALMIVNNAEMAVEGVPHPFHIKLAFSPKPVNEEQMAKSVAHLFNVAKVDGSGDC